MIRTRCLPSELSSAVQHFPPWRLLQGVVHQTTRPWVRLPPTQVVVLPAKPRCAPTTAASALERQVQVVLVPRLVRGGVREARIHDERVRHSVGALHHQHEAQRNVNVRAVTAQQRVCSQPPQCGMHEGQGRPARQLGSEAWRRSPHRPPHDAHVYNCRVHAETPVDIDWCECGKLCAAAAVQLDFHLQSWSGSG